MLSETHGTRTMEITKIYHLAERCGGQRSRCCSVSQSCQTLGDLLDCTPPGSSVHGISQARILEWVAIFFSRGSFQTRDQTHVSCVGRQILYQGILSQ